MLSGRKSFQFGLVADVQHADKDNGGSESRVQRYRQAASCLDCAVNDWSAHAGELLFVLTLGDVIDGNHSQEATQADLERVAASFDRLADKLPTHHVIGNHCLAVERASLLSRMNISSSYRSFRVAPGWRLIILDTTEMSGHSGYAPDSALGLEARAYLQSHPMSDADPQMAMWNGGIGSTQLRWLKTELTDAETAGEHAIVAAHHQAGQGACRPAHMAWNWQDILAALLDSTAFVAYFAGHDHVGGYACIEGKHFVTFEAVLEAPEGSTAYAYVEVDDAAKMLRIDGRGSVTSRTLQFA